MGVPRDGRVCVLMLMMMMMMLNGTVRITDAEIGADIQLLPDEGFVSLGDINLGALNHVHNYDANLMCTDTIYGEGIYQFGLAISYAVDEVNRRDDILPNVTLGYAVLDDCGYTIPSAARSIQFTPILANEEDELSFGEHYDVVGVIGPMGNEASSFTATLYSFMQLPHIAYAATANELGDRFLYPYFYRVVGADMRQTEAIMALVSEMGWNYVSIIYYEDAFGYDALKNLLLNSAPYGVCVGEAIGISSMTEAYEEALDKVQSAGANVVILYLYRDEMLKFTEELVRQDAVGDFIFILTDIFMEGWLPEFGPYYPGSFWVHPYDGSNPGFDEYLRTVNPQTLTNEPWLSEYWEYVFGCTWNDMMTSAEENTCGQYSTLADAPSLDILSWNYRLIDAVFVFAAAIDAVIDDYCPERRGGDVSELRECVDRIRVAEYLYKIEVERPCGVLNFTTTADVLRPYECEQIQGGPGAFRMHSFALWDTPTKEMNLSLTGLDWTGLRVDDTEMADGIPDGLCSYACQPDEIYIQGELECCWDCDSCRNNEIPNSNQTDCVPCPPFMWPDSSVNFTACRTIEPFYISWTHMYGLPLTCMAAGGSLITAIMAAIFYWKRNSKVVLGTGHDTLALLICGSFIGLGSMVFFVAKPGLIVCTAGRVGFTISPLLLFSALSVKSMRIYQTLKGHFGCGAAIDCSSKGRQGIFTASIIAVQLCLMVATCTVWVSDAELRMPVETNEYVELTCVWEMPAILIPLCCNFLLLLLAMVYGFSTRKLSDNFNEPWCVFISVAMIVFIWVSFAPTYFAAFYAFHQSVLIAFALFLNVIVVLACLLAPKIYAVFFVNEERIKLPKFGDRVSKKVPGSSQGTGATASTSIGKNCTTDKPVESTEKFEEGNTAPPTLKETAAVAADLGATNGAAKIDEDPDAIVDVEINPE